MREASVDRAPGTSVRLKLTLSYAGFLMLAGVLLLAVVWVFLLRYVPEEIYNGPGVQPTPAQPGPMFIPDRDDLWTAFAPRAAWALGFLLVFSLVGGWLLAGSMLAPLRRPASAPRPSCSPSRTPARG